MENADDLCPRPERLPPPATEPHAPPIYLASVYECRDPQQIDALVAGREGGYIYARDGHPNADMLAEKCRQLHGAERAAIANSGMAALALVLLSQLEPGDHVVVSNQLYGRTLGLFGGEAARLGIHNTLVDPCDLSAVAAAITPRSKLLLVETISNPLLRVADLAVLAELAEARELTFVVDNTMAGPAICRPRDFGADLVMESITKTMNGHSDVMLGMLCGAADRWQRVPAVLTTWGLASQPFNCWLALRGLATLGAAHGTGVCQRVGGGAAVGRVTSRQARVLSRLERPSRPRAGAPSVRRSLWIDGHVHPAWRRRGGHPFHACRSLDSVLSLAG